MCVGCYSEVITILAKSGNKKLRVGLVSCDFLKVLSRCLKS